MFMLLLVIVISDAGPSAYAACQAGCASGVVVCYPAAGYVFGTVTAGAGTPAAILSCNAAFGKCQAACAAMALAPTA